jgi:hypothetical protein
MAVRFLRDAPSGSPYAQVINMAHIELDQLLGCSADELITLVTPMSASNCEQYASRPRH